MSARATTEQEAFAKAAHLPIFDRGLPPLSSPILAAAIEAKLREERTDRALAGPTRLRCSDAFGCARKVAFSSLGVPKDVQYSAESLIAFRAGDAYHQMAQEAAVAFLDARCEWPVDWTPELSLSGHADAIYTDDNGTVCVEIKSMAGYGFRLATGQGKDEPGPKVDHLLQVGLYGLAPQINANRVHIIYVDKDRNLTAEWVIGVDDPLPHLGGETVRQLVDEEKRRLAGILSDLDAGRLPARDVPGFGIVDVPPAADTRDDPWNCRYCSWQPTCAGLPTEAVEGWVPAFLSRKGAAA